MIQSDTETIDKRGGKHMSWTPVAQSDFSINPFTLIGDEWMLVAARVGARCNMMTASWGGFGVLWGRPVATVYIRPQRYTREFIDEASHFSLSFFEESGRAALNLCGTKSGRDVDKAAEAHLTLENGPQDVPLFAEAKLAVVCHKLYKGRFKQERFLEPALIGAHYPDGDFHHLYIGEVVTLLRQDV
jgi:flavin reductase (DIM6/NTAB) family NADH-FMN oxidoreductase RutF